MSSTELARLDLDERALALMERRARVFAKVPGLRKEIQGNSDAIFGIMLSLQGYGLPITLPGVNMSFDWIQGEAVPSARLYQVLAKRARFELRPLVETPERTVIRMTGPDGTSIDFEYTLEDAISARRLDEWVDNWGTTKDGKRYKAGSWVIRRNGEPWGGDNPPAWVDAEINEGHIKRYDAWWDFRRDMMWKACALRAIRKMAPHVLLGADVIEAEPRFARREDVIDVQVVEPSQPAGPRETPGDDRPAGDTAPEEGSGRML